MTVVVDVVVVVGVLVDVVVTVDVLVEVVVVVSVTVEVVLLVMVVVVRVVVVVVDVVDVEAETAVAPKGRKLRPEAATTDGTVSEQHSFNDDSVRGGKGANSPDLAFLPQGQLQLMHACV